MKTMKFSKKYWELQIGKRKISPILIQEIIIKHSRFLQTTSDIVNVKDYGAVAEMLRGNNAEENKISLIKL
jgi:hypothetical protein